MCSNLRSLLAACAILCTGAASHAQAQGLSNFAPFWVENDGTGSLPSYERAAGPFYEHRNSELELTALRPFWVTLDNESADIKKSYSFYPIFSLWQKDGSYDWNIYHLIRGAHTETPDGDDIGRFEIWPLFWHYDTGDPETSYNALMPIAGTLKNRLFYKRIDWVLFPGYVRMEKHNFADTSILWPIFRVRNGPTDDGWAVWPLYGHFEGEGRYNNTFALWPLFYNNYRYKPGESQPYHALGVLPLYARETAPGLKSETYLWPFFGYTRESDPRPQYGETRYFYPFFVQGRGEEKYVNRWLPFYTHETKPDYEKHWYLWPVLKTEERQLGTVTSNKDSVLFFLWQNEVQTAAHQPDFEARKTSLWPLFTWWDDGNGQRQLQALSPLEPIFPGNRAMQSTWSSFFALYRYEGSADASRHSVLWDLIYWEDSQEGSSFSIGPLFEHADGDEGGRWSLLKGLLTVRRPETGGTKLSGLWGLLK